MKYYRGSLSIAVVALVGLTALVLPQAPAAEAGSPWGAIIKHRKKQQCALAVDAAEGAFADKGTETKRLKAIDALGACIEDLASKGELEQPARALRIGVDAIQSAPKRLVTEPWDDVSNGARLSVERLMVDDLDGNAEQIVACSTEIPRLDPDLVEFRQHRIRAGASLGQTAEVDTRYLLDHLHDLRPVGRIKPVLVEACKTSLGQWDALEDAAGIGEDCVRNLRAQGLPAAQAEVEAIIAAHAEPVEPADAATESEE